MQPLSAYTGQRSRFRCLLLLAACLLPVTAQANCPLKQTACETSCKVRYFDDTLGKVGCLTQCKAERVACSAKESASEASEKTKSLLNN